jgi:hypothetical protein
MSQQVLLRKNPFHSELLKAINAFMHATFAAFHWQW